MFVASSVVGGPLERSPAPPARATVAADSPPAWAAEVVSSNIVGYQKVTLQPGFNFVAPQFTAVGGGAIDLQSIKLDVADEDATGGDSIQILDDGGSTVETYFWFPKDWTASGENSGWVDGSTGDPVDMTLDSGLSVLLDSASDATVTIAGEVSPNAAEVVTVAGFNFVGNASPVVIDIQDIQIDVDDADATGGDSIQILDDGGSTIETFFWFPAEWTASGTKSGWVDGSTGDLAEVDLAPGQGFLLDIATDGTTVTIPPAL